MTWAHNGQDIPGGVAKAYPGAGDLKSEVITISRWLTANLAGKYTCAVTQDGITKSDSTTLYIRGAKSPDYKVFKWDNSSDSISITIGAFFYGDVVSKCTWLDINGFVVENDAVYTPNFRYDANSYTNYCTLTIKRPPNVDSSNFHGVYRCSALWTKTDKQLSKESLSLESKMVISGITGKR